jgi:hypothetical protein
MGLRGILFVVGAMAVVASPLRVLADRIELASGEIFTGKVLRVNDHEVSIQLGGGGIISFSLSAVRSIRRSADGEEESILVYENPSEKTKEDPPESSPPTAVSAPARSNERTSPSVEGTAPKVGDAKPPPRPAESRTPEEPTTVDAGELSFHLPQGFLPWPSGKSSTIAQAFRDPVSRSSLTIASYDTEDSPDEIKRNVLRACADKFKTFHVVRDDPLEVPGAPAASGARVLEVECRIGNILIRQTQVLLRSHDKALVLTYSTAGDVAENGRRSIEQSLRSIRLSHPEPEPAPRAPEIGIPRLLDTAPRASRANPGTP